MNIKQLKQKILNSKLVSDSFWAVFGNVAGRGLALSGAIIIARILGKDIYGEYGIVKSTLVAIAILSTFGLNYTATKYVAEYKNDAPGKLRLVVRVAQKMTLIVSSILALIIILLAPYIATYALEAPQLTFPLRLIGVFIIFDALTRTQIGILAGLGEFKGIAKINAMVGGLTFLVGVVLTYFYGLTGALIALLIVQIANCLLNSRLTQKKIAVFPAAEKNPAFAKEIMKFSLPVALQEAFYSVINWTYGLLLIKFSTYGEMGLYAAALHWNAVILFIPGVLRNVVLSHMSGSLKNVAEHTKILRTVLAFNFGITFTISILFFLFSSFITSFYGANFAGLGKVINITVFTTIFISMSNVYAQAYMSKNKNWLMLFFRIIRDGSIFIIVYILLSRNNGEEGALSLAYSALFSNILFLALMATIYEKKIKYN